MYTFCKLCTRGSAVADAFRIYVMPAQALLRDPFPVRPGLSVVGVRIDGQTAARKELAPDFDVLGLQECHQVVEDDIDAVLMEIAVVAKTEDSGQLNFTK